MSLYNDASLVMIPSAYKDGKLYSIKPTDGSGDFTFSRGSNLAATRVDENGLIEKGRENLLLQSNQFDTTWGKTNVSVTGGQSGYDGNGAWLLDITGGAGSQRADQFISQNGVQTFSVYAKANTLDWMLLYVNAGTLTRAYFDIANGIIGGTNNLIDSNITDVGNGWYKCSITFDKTITDVRIYLANDDGNITQSSGSIYIQDAQLEKGLVATDYIETTTTTAQAGILEDMPRLDYSGGASCPSLLLEPTRTNLFDQSEFYNTYYTLDGLSVSDNALISPEGLQNASKFIEDSANSKHRIGKATFPSGTERTLSVFAKAGERNYISLFENNVVGDTLKGVIFNLSNGTLSINNAPSYYSNPTIESYGNGWYRCSATWTSSSLSVPSIGISADGLNNSYQGDGTSGIYIYGAMLESGSYPTSYIPCYGAATTRSGDTSTNAIANTSGDYFTLFIDYADFKNGGVNGDDSIFFRDINNAVIFALWGLNQGFTIRSLSGDTNNNYYTGNQFGLTSKAIVRYDGTEIGLFLNGVKQTLSGSADESNWNQLYKISLLRASDNKYKMKGLAVFPTALTDSECIALTTI